MGIVKSKFICRGCKKEYPCNLISSLFKKALVPTGCPYGNNPNVKWKRYGIIKTKE